MCNYKQAQTLAVQSLAYIMSLEVKRAIKRISKTAFSSFSKPVFCVNLTLQNTTLLVRRTVPRKCPVSKFNQELRRVVWRYGVRRTNIFVISAGRSGVKVRLNFPAYRPGRFMDLVGLTSEGVHGFKMAVGPWVRGS